MEDLLREALDVAISAGANYADIRVVHSETESLALRGPTIEALDRSDSLGFGVRVLFGGAWGYAASSVLERQEVRRAALAAVTIARSGARLVRTPVELAPEPAHVDTWTTPHEIDPFSIPLEEKVSLLAAATEVMGNVRGVHAARGTIDLVRQKTSFSSSESARIDQTIIHTGAGIEATAVAEGEVQTRSYPGSFRGHLGAGGYEIIGAMDLVGAAERTAEEAVALLGAPECPVGEKTLVLDGHQVMLQVHESVGHATELDRVLGLEAAFAGTSFVGLDDLGRYRYGSDLVTITSDATEPGGLGTYGYDDEGVLAQRTDLVRDGVLVGFQTSRETAMAAGAPRSNGTMRAEGWENFPLIRMPNINLMPREGSLDDLLAGVDDGIYMATNKSWSIDDKRKNFQFGCEIAWEIKDGALGRMFKNPRYTGITPEFWASCDAIGGPEEWRMWGTPNCGKGQPGQTMRVGHGTAPARFQKVQTGFGE